MKNLITLLLLSIGLSVNAQIATNGTNNSGIDASAMGYQATASGDYSTAMGYYSTASNYASTAMGDSSTASGEKSTAMGVFTTASGFASTAMGYETTASGSQSTAMGKNTKAFGGRSTAMGLYTIASDYASTVIGSYNSSGSSVTSATSFNTANTAFVVGNGTDESSRSDAFKVMFNGDAYVSNSLYLGGTKITSTAAELNLLSGVTALGTGILEPVTENGNTGVRLSSSDAANHGDIGNNAVDLSYSNISSSTRGATGSSSTAMGFNTTASGPYSTAMGYETTASGFHSTARGYATTASGTASTAMGGNTTASASNSTAMGYRTTASGVYSTAMGTYTTASDYASTVIGQYNSSGSTTTSVDSPSPYAPAFVIGNGTSTSFRSDAFKVMFNGDTTVGGDITISSDARLKSNIVSLGSTLSKLLLIDGKSYEKDGKQRIGVLAQEIQEVFPELVTEDGNEMLAVNYQGLVPVLINAIKEQEDKISRLETMIEKLISNQ